MTTHKNISVGTDWVDVLTIAEVEPGDEVVIQNLTPKPLIVNTGTTKPEVGDISGCILPEYATYKYAGSEFLYVKTTSFGRTSVSVSTSQTPT